MLPKTCCTAVTLVLMTACGRPPMQPLIDVSRGVRVTEARLCGFHYARPTHLRGELQTETTSALRVEATAVELLNKTISEGKETQHVRGIAELLRHRPHLAVKELEHVVATDRSDARGWTDLAAARYEIARQDDDAEEYASALAAAKNAIEIDESIPEAQFNFALAAAALHLDRAAEGALRHCVTLDSGSAWTDEDRQRLQHLAQRNEAEEWARRTPRLERDPTDGEIIDAVARFAQETRTWGEGEYLARWGEAVLSHRDADSGHWLRLASSIGDALQKRTGESLLHDAVAAVANADISARTDLARAHVVYRRGRKSYSQRSIVEAIPMLAEAEHAFAANRSPMALVARYYRANALTDHHQITEAMALLADIESRLPPRYIALRANVLWQRGYALARLGRLYESLDSSRSGLVLFERLGEEENLSRMLSNVGGTMATLGQIQAAWTLHRRAFFAATKSGSENALAQALEMAARDARRDGGRDIANALLDIELSKPSTSPRLRVDALLQRVDSKQGDWPARLAVARTVAATISDPMLRAEALDDIRFGEALLIDDAAHSLQLLSESVTFRKQNGRWLTLPETYLQRSRVFQRLHRLPEAEADLNCAASAVEAQRANVEDPELSDTFLETAAHIYRDLFQLYIARGNHAAAFNLVERTRAPLLIEKLTDRHAINAQPLRAEQIAAKLPQRMHIVQYTTGPDGVTILALGRNGLTAHHTEAPLTTIDTPQSPATFSNDTAERLFDALVRPIKNEIAGDDTVVIVPDDQTASIPFAALRDRDTGGYWIEHVRLVTAPSASALTGARPPLRCRRVLIVGDPAFDSRLFIGLPRLAGAAKEARRLSAVYPECRLLVDIEATAAKVQRELASSDLVHLGAHAIVSQRNPTASLLVLAPDRGRSGTLYLRDIAAMNLSRHPTVILAGCKTAFPSSRGGSIRSLALAFLAAGSSEVVGSLWDVDDDVTEVFALKFHEELRRGAGAADALRLAQLMMLRSPDPRLRATGAWGAFTTYVQF